MPSPTPSDDETTVAELRRNMAAFVAERDWQQFHTPKNIAMALVLALIPIFIAIWCHRALASGAFVTTVTDVVGFFAFLGLAAAVLL